MMSSGFPSTSPSSLLGDSDAGVEFFGVDLRRFAGVGDAVSITLISERRLLTPLVERALRRGSGRSKVMSTLLWVCGVEMALQPQRQRGVEVEAKRGWDCGR